MVKSTVVGEDVIEANTPPLASSDAKAATDLEVLSVDDMLEVLNDDASPAQAKPAPLSFPVAVKIPASSGIAFETVAQLALWSLIPRADPLPDIGTSADLAAVVKEARPLIHAADFLQMDDILADIQDKLLGALRAFQDACPLKKSGDDANARSKLDGLIELLDLAHSFRLDVAFAAAKNIISRATYAHSKRGHWLTVYLNDAGTIVPGSKMAKLPPVVRSEVLAAALKCLATY